MRRLASVLFVVALLTAGGFGYLAGSAGMLAPAQAVAADECQTFPQTSKQVCGRFLEYWRTNGGLAQQGLPLSDAFREQSSVDGKTYTVQYFERAVFEAHPENQRPYDVLLSLLGTEKYRAKYPNGPGGAPPASPPPATNPGGYPRTANGDGITLTVYEVRDPGPTTTYSKPEAGNRFVAIDVQLRNTGSDEISTNKLYFRLRTADGRDWQVTFVSVPEPQVGLLELQPGQDTRGWITFELPQGTALVNLSFDFILRDGAAIVPLN